MVLRRTVRRRRRWSEALAGGGPSIPLPSTRQKRSRHSRPGPEHPLAVRFAYPYGADLDGHIEREYHPGN